MRRFRSSLLMLIAALAWTAPASAQADFTIHVPVELHSLHPNITSFQVLCTMAALTQTVGPAITSPEIGLDSGGNYLGPPIVVEFYLPDLSYELKSSAAEYTCYLLLVGMGGPINPSVDGPEDIRPKTGTPFEKTSRGPIVQPGLSM